MSSLQELADRVERLLLRHDELKRTVELLERQLDSVAHERDSARAGGAGARPRIAAGRARLPDDAAAGAGGAP